jgi:hypothetical protein
MMKKLLVLMMVLGMATMANATIQLSVNGIIDGGENVTDITLMPSDTITIDIWNDAGQSPINFTAYLDIYPNNTGCFDTANARLGDHAGDFPSNFVMDVLGDIDEYTVYQNWAPGTVTDTEGAIFLIDLHCLSPDNIVTVELYDERVDEGYTIVDTLIIHQIPEPMTLVLLGIGGLFLKRRK